MIGAGWEPQEAVRVVVMLHYASQVWYVENSSPWESGRRGRGQGSVGG